ncbi:MAG: NAD(P)-dependent oxidoreductase [Thermoplasmatales archaeon]|nr:NAD(P)-dependent oxidoreductase [Thermoplasmatales archaeon]
MKVLITGHTGFIGSNMFQSLKKKRYVEPVGFARTTGQDIFDTNQLNKFVKDCDIVYHFAAYAKPGESITHPVRAIDINVKGCVRILESCRKYDVPLIYPSSCEIYGDSDKPLKEDNPLNPTNPYAASKVAADRICYSYYKAYGLDVKIVRLFNPYGPNQQLNKIIPVFYSQAVRDKPITVYGKGSDTRDYVYIDDIVRGLWIARKLSKGEYVNLATGRKTTNLEMAKLILKATDGKSRISFTPYPKEFGNIRNQVGSYEKAKKAIGWHPRIKLEEGVKKTISWLKSVSGEKNESEQ